MDRNFAAEYRDDLQRRQQAEALAREMEERSRLAIHHKDGDPTNNDLANLELVDIGENRRGERTKP